MNLISNKILCERKKKFFSGTKRWRDMRDYGELIVGELYLGYVILVSGSSSSLGPIISSGLPIRI